MPRRIVLEPTGEEIADRIVVAQGWTERVRGLRGLPQLLRGEALVIVGAWQVHTFGMTYPIDVVFCASNGSVRHVVRRLRRRRVTRVVPWAAMAIELPGGSLPPAVRKGAILRLEARSPGTCTRG